MNSLEKWLYWKESLIDSFEKREYIELGFLTEVVEIEHDGYGGTNKMFYFKDGAFYSKLSHWDGSNFTANRSYDHTLLSKENFSQILDKKKADVLQILPEDDTIAFETVFNDVRTLLLKQFENDKYLGI